MGAMRHLLTIRFDRELRERVQREVERNRSNIDTEIMALVDAALEHLTRRLPTSDLDPQEANRSMLRTTSREGPWTRCAPSLLDEFVRIWDQKFPRASALIRT